MKPIDCFFAGASNNDVRFDRLQIAASINDVDYLQKTSIDLNAYASGLSPLHCAASNLAYDTTAYLAPLFLRKVDENGRSALRLFLDSAISNDIENQDTINAFLEHLSAEIDLIAKDQKPTLHLAFALNSETLIERAFESEKDCVDANGTTSLMIAAKYGHTKYFKRLEHQLNSADVHGRNAAFYAVQADEVDMMLLLIDTLYDNRDAEDRTLLHEAARHNSLRCLELLKMTYLNNSDDYGNPALFEAAYFNHRWAVQLLSEEMYLSNRNGDTALHFAAKHDCFDVVGLLEDLSGVRNYQDKLAIDIAIENDGYNAFEALLVIEARDDLLMRIVDCSAYRCLMVLFKLSKLSVPLAQTAKQLLGRMLGEHGALFRAISHFKNEIIRVFAKHIPRSVDGANALAYARDGGFFDALNEKAEKALLRIGSPQEPTGNQ